jgi:hypothetical protein
MNDLASIMDSIAIEQRPYQERVVNKSLDYFRKGIKSVLINSPTGSGKTVMGLTAAKVLQDTRDIGVGWVAMRRNLLSQASESNIEMKFGVDAQFISMFDNNPPTHDKAGRPIKLIVMDEAQHDAASSMSHIHNLLQPQYVLGLSATPYRTDRIKLCFEKVVIDAGIHQLIQQGYLSPYHQYIIPEWTPECVVEHYLKDPQKWGKSVFYWLNQDLCMECLRLLKDAGIKAELVIGTQSEKEREKHLDDFDSGKIDALVNMYVLTEGWDCLDEQTEVLTSNGWKHYQQIQIDDLLYSINRNTGLMELVEIEGKDIRPVRQGERLVEIKSQHLDIRVTEGHEFHLKYRDPKIGGSLSSNWITRTGGDLVERQSPFGIPLAAESELPGIDLSDDEIKFIAWSLTDSSWNANYLSLHQSEKPTKHSDRIRSLLVRLGLDFTERYRQPSECGFETEFGMIEFNIPKGTSKAQPRNGWVKYQDYLSDTKQIVPSLQAMSREQFLVFFDELVLANGERNSENHSGWVWTQRKHQADDLNIMAIVRGFASNIGTKPTNNGTIMYRVTARNRSWMVIDPSDEHSASIEFTQPKENELVWCLKNKNGTLVIRRNGKTAIVGNCPSLKTAWVRDSQKGPTIQMAGRVFRKYVGMSVKQVVQSNHTHHPMVKTATPQESFVWMDESWRSVKPSDKADRVSNATIHALAHSTAIMPKFITERRKKDKPQSFRF